MGLCGLTVECSLAIQKVAGSYLGRSASRKQPWASCSHACASVTKQYNLVRSLARKVTADLAESNGSLPPGGWLQVTCGLTACTQGSALSPTLANEYGRTVPFTFTVVFGMYTLQQQLFSCTGHRLTTDALICCCTNTM